MTNEIIMGIVSTMFGIMIGGVYCSRVVERKRCKVLCQARYLGKELHKVRNAIHAFGKFEYRYQGKDYTGRTDETLTFREEKRLKEGGYYPIYINPNRPQRIRFLRWIVTPGEIFLITMGTACVGGGIWYIIKGIIDLF